MRKSRAYTIVALLILLLGLGIWFVAYRNNGEEVPTPAPITTTTNNTSTTQASSLVGSYFVPVTTEVNDFETGETVPLKTYDLLTIEGQTPNTLSYSFMLNGTNYHSCSAKGLAAKKGASNVYEEERPVDGGSCRLRLTVDADSITFEEVDNGRDMCSSLCGARASIEKTDFKLANTTTTPALMEEGVME